MIALGRRAGIRRLTTSPHKLRHTTNVIARMSGVDALTRAAMLNHRSMKTLARYDHLVPGEVARGREQQRAGLAAYLAQARPVVSPDKSDCEPDLRSTPPNVPCNPSDLQRPENRVPCARPSGDSYQI